MSHVASCRPLQGDDVAAFSVTGLPLSREFCIFEPVISQISPSQVENNVLCFEEKLTLFFLFLQLLPLSLTCYRCTVLFLRIFQASSVRRISPERSVDSCWRHGQRGQAVRRPQLPADPGVRR